MIELIKYCLWISLLPFSFSLMLDVVLGYPAKEEFDSKAIFFSFSFWLAKRRLSKYHKYRDILSGFKDALNHKDVFVRDVAKKTFKQAVFSEGRDSFTWELGWGMCPVCTNVRISIVFAAFCILYFHLAWVLLLIVPCFSNIYLLLFNKLKN